MLANSRATQVLPFASKAGSYKVGGASAQSDIPLSHPVTAPSTIQPTIPFIPVTQAAHGKAALSTTAA